MKYGMMSAKMSFPIQLYRASRLDISAGPLDHPSQWGWGSTINHIQIQ